MQKLEGYEILDITCIKRLSQAAHQRVKCDLLKQCPVGVIYVTLLVYKRML